MEIFTFYNGIHYFFKSGFVPTFSRDVPVMKILPRQVLVCLQISSGETLSFSVCAYVYGIHSSHIYGVHFSHYLFTHSFDLKRV